MYSTKRRLLSFTLVALMASSTGTVYADATSPTNQVKGVMAVEDTKGRVEVLANQLLAREDLVRRFLGTVYMHPQVAGHYTGTDRSAVPKEIIRDTPWYCTWEAAYETKLFLGSYDEKLAKNAMSNLNYYDKLYAFPMSHHLTKDGFYKGDYKTYTMQFLGGNPAVQAFYKMKEENKDIRKLFSHVGVFKRGNELEVNFALNKDEARNIEYVSVGHIATILPIAELGPTAEEKTLFSVVIPGELTGDELVITELSYVDKNGVKKKTGTFGVDIDYSKLAFDKNYEIPGQKERVKQIAEAWINRGYAVLDELSETDHPTEAREIRGAIEKLTALKAKADLNQDEIYAVVAPIYISENEATLRELISEKITKHIDIVKTGFYKEKDYTKESIKAYANFLNRANSNNEYMSLGELVELDKKLDRASSNTILRFNTAYLEKLLAIADSKHVTNYTEESLGAFYTAKSGAKKWVEKNKASRPQLNETGEHIDTLLKAINNLERIDGTSETPIKKEDLYDNKIEAPEVEKVYSVNGAIKYFYDSNQDTPLAAMFESKMRLTETAGNKGKLQINLKPLKDQAGNSLKVITKVEYNNNGRFSEAKVIKREETTIKNSLQQEIPVVYPSVIELNVDTASNAQMNLDLTLHDGSNRPIPDSVALKVNYDRKREESSSGANDKLELQNKVNALKKEFSEGYLKTLPSKQTETLLSLLETTKTLLENAQASSVEYKVALKNLEKEEEHLSKVDALLDAHKALKKDCETWKKTNQYTKASIEAIIGGLNEIETDFNHQKLSDQMIQTQESKIQALRAEAIVNTESLVQKIASAKEKAQGSEGKAEQRRALSAAIDNAEAYIKDVNEKKNHTNRVNYYIDQLNFLMKALEEKDSPNLDPNPPQPQPQPNPNPGGEPQGPDVTTEKVYTVNVRFVKDNLTTPSHANGVLITKAKLVTKGEKHTLFMKLQPLPGGDGTPSGVVTGLSYYVNNEKKPMTKLKEGSVDISYEGRVQSYTYPTEVSFPVDGQTKHVKCNTVSKSPATGQDAHDHDVILEIDYEHKIEGYSEQQVNKSELITLLNVVKGDYYARMKETVPSLHWTKLAEAIQKAEAIVQKSTASEDEVNTAYYDLGQKKTYVDFCIIAQSTQASVATDLAMDFNDAKYSQQSRDKAKAFVEEKNKLVGELLKQTDFSVDAGHALLEELRNYYLELRYDVSTLESLLSQAKEKLNYQTYTKDSLDHLREAVIEAEDYVQKAKASRKVSDDRAKYQDSLQTALQNLVEKGTGNPSQPINTTTLEQKIIEAQTQITDSNYTEASIQAVRQVITEAQAYIQGVKNGSETTNKVQGYLTALNESLAKLVQKQVQTLQGSLEAHFTQPNGSSSMMERFFPEKKVDVTYLIQDNKTIYDFVLAPAQVGTVSLSEEAAATEAVGVEEQAETALPQAEQEVVTPQSVPEAVDTLALTSEDIKLWYVDNDGMEKAMTSEALADGKLKFHFEKMGKVDPNLNLKVLVKAMPSGQKMGVRLNIVVPENFYGALETEEKQNLKDELKKEIAQIDEFLSLEPSDKSSQYDTLKTSLESAKAKAIQAITSGEKALLENTLKEIKEKREAFTQSFPKVLEMKQAKTGLQKQIELANAKKEVDYEKDSFTPFAKALEKAKAVLNQATIRQKDLDEAISDLEKATNALKTKASISSGGGGGGGGSYPLPTKVENNNKTGEPKEGVLAPTASQGLKAVFKIGQKSYLVIKEGKQEAYHFDVAPIVKNGKTMLSARMIGELLGVKVDFDSKTKTAKFTYATDKASNSLSLTLGKQMMEINGKNRALSTPIVLEKGRILLPLRDIQVALKELGLETSLEWNHQTKEVTLNK